MRNECFALRLCSVLKDLLGLEKVFILNYGDPIHSAQVCLLNSILRRALIRNIQDRAWIQREGEGWRKDPGDIQGSSVAPPQAHWSVSPPALPTLFPTYIYIVVSWVMGQSIPFSFSIIPETSSCYSWHFSNWEHSEMWLLAQKKKNKNLNFNCGAPGPAVSLTFESVNLIWSSSLEADRPCWTWAV